MASEILAIGVNVIYGIEYATPLLNQEAISLQGCEEAPDVGLGGWVFVGVVVDDLQEGGDGGISTPGGENHLMYPLGVEGGQFCDGKEQVRGSQLGGCDAEGNVVRHPDLLFV